LGELEREDFESDALERDYNNLLLDNPHLLDLRPQKQSAQARLEDAKRLGYAGELGPLRELYTEIVEFLAVPKRKRGQRRSYRNVSANFKRFSLRLVVRDVQRIRKLWQQHYGLKNRRGGQVSAEEIAGRRHGMTEDEVHKAKEKVSRPRRR
jgi:hypothetical protein